MAMQVVATATLVCSFGTAPCALNVVPSTVLGEKKNAANIMDHVTGTNVPGFTMCTSPSNPAVIANGMAPAPCTPVLPAPWAPGKPDILLRGQPTLDSDSKLMCAYAGVISVTSPGEGSIIVN